MSATATTTRPGTLELGLCPRLPAAVSGQLEALPDLARQLLGWLAIDASDRRAGYRTTAMMRWLRCGRSMLVFVEDLLRRRGLIVIEHRTKAYRSVLLPWLGVDSARWAQ